MFEQLCPYYMAMGMSYAEFWYKDVKLAEYYRKADEIRTRKRNHELWLQGAYIYEALCDASPLFRLSMKKGMVRPEPYAKEPYPITQAEVDERTARDARAKEERMKAEFAAFVQGMIDRKKPREAHPDSEGDVNVHND